MDLHYAFVELCSETFAQEAYYNELINAVVTKIFVLLLRRYMSDCELPAHQPEDSDAAIRIARYIQDHAADVTLASLAQDFHYSPEHASRMIRRTTGQTFMQLLTSIRLENAKQLLRDTSVSILDIAIQIGYEGSDQFIRAFRRQNGITPNEYRRKYRRS